VARLVLLNSELLAHSWDSIDHKHTLYR